MNFAPPLEPSRGIEPKDPPAISVDHAGVPNPHPLFPTLHHLGTPTLERVPPMESRNQLHIHDTRPKSNRSKTSDAQNHGLDKPTPSMAKHPLHWSNRTHPPNLDPTHLIHLAKPAKPTESAKSIACGPSARAGPVTIKAPAMAQSQRSAVGQNNKAPLHSPDCRRPRKKR